MSTVARSGAVRLTRRGRFVLRGMLAMLAMAGLILILALPGQAADPPTGELPTIVVSEGDTLWSIAQRHAPRRDRFAVVDEIRRLNHLDGYVIRTHQELLLPRVG